MNESHLQLTVYLGETDLSGDLPLYEVIIRRLLHLNISGATAVRGLMGFGRHGKVHRQRLFGVSDDRPILVVAIDEEHKIRRAAPEISRLAPKGLVTLSPIEIVPHL